MTRAKDISKIITAPVFSGLTYPTSDGSANQFMKTDGSGNLTFASVAQENTTINNNADNRIITGSGTANTLEGEANLTFDGSTLGLTGNLTVSGAFTSQGIDDNADATAITIDSNEDITITKQGTNTTDLRFANSTNSFGGNIKYDHNSGRMMIHTHNAERVRIDASGNLGIGVSSVSNTLHLDSGGATTTLQIDSDTESSIDFNDHGGSAKRYKIGTNISDNNGQLEFKDMTANVSRMRIDSSGNVIIGETSQINGGNLNLATSGDNAIISTLVRSTNNDHTSKIVLQKSSTNSGNFAATANGEALGQILFRGVDTQPVSQVGGAIEVVQSGTASGSVPANMKFSTNGTERMRIFSDGDVAIGGTEVGNAGTISLNVGTVGSTSGGLQLWNTTSASHSVQFGDESGTASNHYRGYMEYHHNGDSLRFGTASTERMRIDGSGLMINTSTAFNHLNGRGDIVVGNGSSNGGMTIFTGSSNQGAIAFADGTSGDQAYRGMIEYDQSNDSMAFKTAVTERMRISSAGRIGIATTDPRAFLHIGTGFGGGNLLPNASIMMGANDTRNIVFQAQSGNGVEGTIGSWNGVYNFQGSKIEFNKPAGNLSEMRFYTNAGSGITNRMHISYNGAVSIYGSLSKGSGSFKIDHPLPSKTKTHNLVHSFVESPQANNIYRGKVVLVDGSATVNIDTVSDMTDGTYVLLNTNTQCFTSNETGWTAVKGSVSGNILTITSQVSCTDTISWLVIGERHDQHMIDTEWTDEKGKVIVEPLKKE